MSSKTNTFAKAEMLIRQPIAQVFDAFINPEVTKKFWFTKSTGKLQEGVSVNWVWEMYDLTVPVMVKNIEPNKHIQIEWGEGDDTSTVEWSFKILGESKTFVQIINDNFRGTQEEVVQRVIDSTGGFTMVLAGLKAWLEHKIELNLIGDKFPKELLEK